MPTFRSAVTALALSVFSVFSAGALVQAYLIGLPNVPAMDRAELLRQLTTSDLGRVSRSVQLSWARVAEEEIREGLDWKAEFEGLNAAEQERFTANYGHLVRAWLESKVERYFALNKRHRQEYLDQEIGGLLSLVAANEEGGDGSPPRFSQAAIVQDVVRQTYRWYEEADAEERARLDEFIAAARERIMRQLNARWMGRSR